MAQNDPSFRELVFNGTFCSLGNSTPIPENVVQALGKIRDFRRLFLLYRDILLGLDLALVLVALFPNRRVL